MTKNHLKSVTYLPVEEELFTFLNFSLFSQQMAEKIGSEMQKQGIKMKRPAIPTKVCRFPSHNCRLKSTYWNLFCMILQSWTKSVEKFAFSYSQETHPTNLPPQRSLPPPLSGQRCSVRSKNVPAVLQIVCWAGRGKYVEWTVIYRDVFWN